jgi:hypothetical protein
MDNLHEFSWKNIDSILSDASVTPGDYNIFGFS